jgi:type I restriction enzyme, S subunit
MTAIVPLGEIVGPASVERAGSKSLTVLSMTSSKGLVPQSSIFKKRIASGDLANYKIVRPNQLVVGIHIDEGAVGFSGAEQVGIVSPAYSIWELKDQSSIHVPYLERFIRSPRALVYFASKYRETAERRGKLTQDQFLSLSVPLPDVAQQRRVASILEKAEVLRLKRREALAQLDCLVQSIFVEMFGDPLCNPKGWLKTPISNVCDSPEDIKCGPFGTQLSKSEVTEEGVPLWGIKNVNAQFHLPAFEFLTSTTARRLEAYGLRAGDIVMTRKGTVGNCAVYPASLPDGVMHSDLLRIRTAHRKCEPFFLSHQLHYSKDVERQLALISGGAVMPGINVSKLRGLEVLVPPIESQREFSNRVSTVGALKAKLVESERALSATFASLQDHAFRGKL